MIQKSFRKIWIFVMLAVMVIGGFFVWRYYSNKDLMLAEINLSKIDFSSCFSVKPERDYRVINDNPSLIERLEYTLKDDQDNYLNDLLFLRYKNVREASSKFEGILYESRCESVECERIKVKSLNAVRVKTEWGLRAEREEASYNTEYNILVNDLLISSTGNAYNWQDSEKYSRDVLECVIDIIFSLE